MMIKRGKKKKTTPHQNPNNKNETLLPEKLNCTTPVSHVCSDPRHPEMGVKFRDGEKEFKALVISLCTICLEQEGGIRSMRAIQGLSINLISSARCSHE